MFSEFSLDFEPSLTPRVDLTPEAVSRALAIAQRMRQTELRWQSYRALLAFEGLIHWLEQRDSPIPFEPEGARLIEPMGFDHSAVINSVRLHHFLCCIVCVDEDTVELPVEVVDDPNQVAHFYVAIAVHEEQQQVTLQSFIRYDQLKQYQQDSRLSMTVDQTYEIPVSSFETDFDQLSLYLTCLEPQAIALPESRLSSESRLHQWLIEPSVNAIEWLQREVNTISDTLTWTFFTPTASALRSPQFLITNDQLSAVLTELERGGIHIPEQAQAAYRSITIADLTIRLTVIVWQVDNSSEWSLLAILEAVQGENLPIETQLTIYENQTPIVHSVSLDDSRYLVAQVFGEIGEQFVIEIRLAKGDRLTLPAFTFLNS